MDGPGLCWHCWHEAEAGRPEEIQELLEIARELSKEAQPQHRARLAVPGTSNLRAESSLGA